MHGALRAGPYRRLRDLLDHYGAAVERDLFDRGWDLSDLVQGRRWRLLLNVIDGLPRDSAFGEALALDEEIAAAASGKADARPSVREWTPEVELLAAIHDRLIDVVQVQMDKKYQADQWPRPLTAAEMLRRKESRRRRARVRELFKPSGGE